MAREELEAALRRNIDDDHAWAMLGDLLSAEGDSRGELIALELRAAACRTPFERSVLTHQAASLHDREVRRWLGPLADASLELGWTRGFIREAVIGRRHVAVLRQLLELPVAVLLHKLVFVGLGSAKTVAELLEPRPNGPRLELLELRGLASDDLSPLARLTELEQLIVEGGHAGQLAALAELPRLSRLTLRRCDANLADLAHGFTALHTLDLSARSNVAALGPEALAPLAGRSTLRRLMLADGGWTELDPLADLRALEHLDLRSSSITRLDPLSGLHELRELDLSGCHGVSWLGPLSGLAQLERLHLRYTQVRDLSPLRGAARLRVLQLGGAPVSSVAPLFELPALTKVGVEACEIHDLEPLIRRGVSVHGVRPRALSWREVAERLLE